MINLKINNSDVTVKEGSTIMEAAEKKWYFCATFLLSQKAFNRSQLSDVSG